MNRITKLLACLVIGFFCLAFPNLVEAEEINIPDGFLIGDDSGISVTKDGGYFFNLDDLMPGDTITRNLIIQNNRSEDYRLKMIITPKSHEGPVNLIESIEMTFTQNDRLIYEGNLSSDENGATVDSREVDLGTIAAGSEQTIAINLRVLNNIPFDEFMSGPSKAVVTWTFVAETETEPSTSGTEPSTTEPSSSSKEEPISSSATKPSTSKPTGSYPSTGELPAKILFTLGGIFLIITAILFYIFYIRKDSDTEGTN
ncbi:hypothetical protein I6N96_16770 [Enterococcus sp. BWM-S5]|uniref:LPXTG cell wall anchor domain-containing protein n=1 Tax=Enterococcus larvae TaxID=2794352 RepID=A0ABS4CNA5_9ENTE|nr:hypothetical protein [Enterococcus larvae]MBP1047945.1 hypothetical protein [Enterococcus larvae]